MNREDEERFDEFVATRSPALLRTAYLLTGDRGRAEDLVQTALAKTYLAWGRIRDQGAVETYVRRVMATTATSWWRRRWRTEYPVAVLPDTPAADATASLVERDAFWALLDGLSARQRAVVALRFYDDMTEAQVADALGVSPGTVKRHTARALDALRADLVPATSSMTQEVQR